MNTLYESSADAQLSRLCAFSLAIQERIQSVTETIQKGVRMKDLIRRIQALEAVAKRNGAGYIARLINGKTKHVKAPEAIQLVRDAQAKSIEADATIQGTTGGGILLEMLNCLIEG